jgi:hypothetical protein
VTPTHPLPDEPVVPVTPTNPVDPPDVPTTNGGGENPVAPGDPQPGTGPTPDGRVDPVIEGPGVEATAAPIVRVASVSLSNTLDAMARQMGSRGPSEPTSVRAVKQAFVAITVGYVVWSLRGASLLASLLTSMPLWRSLDPLPILENRMKVFVKRKKKEKKRQAKAERVAAAERAKSGAAAGDQPWREMLR